jgi:16S rRNA (guanine(966)-N(2))-methyltransferase RsmD
MLGSVEGCRVLALFAGSGARGIEALSRGAAWAAFVDQDAGSCAAIQHNLRLAGLAERAVVRRIPADRALRSLEAEYDVVFIDPPYADPGMEQLLAQVAASPRLVPGAVVVVFHSSRLSLAPHYNGLGLLRERRHGDTTVSIYRKGEPR